MRVTIFAISTCQSTPIIIDYFLSKEYEIDSVIIERNFRKRYSKNEIEYRKKHDRFNRKTKKYPFLRRLARRFWDMTPLYFRKQIQLNIYSIPFLNRFAVQKFCEKRNVKAFTVLKHSSEETRQILLNRNIDIIINASSNWLLKEPIISLRNTKIINAHSGWLPKYKGLDSIPWSLKECDKVGITTHFVDAGIDSGDILRFYEVKIEKGDNFNMIKSKVDSLRPKAYYDTIVGLDRNEITPKPQDGKYYPLTPMSYEELWELEQGLIAQGQDR